MFSDALSDLLAPLARAMVAHGVTVGAVTESMKVALLNAAIEAQGEDVSDSRVSVMTGLHRKDVRRLRSDAPMTDGRKTANRLALLIGHWATAPDFLGENDRPRALPRDISSEGPGFDDLVRHVRLDAAPGTMRRALLDHGAVTEDDDGRLHLVTNALVPGAGSKELVAAYRATLTTHMTAATQNLLAAPTETRHFDRVVKYSHLSDGSVAELEALARAESQALLERLNARARELQDRDADQGVHGRFAAGAYVLPEQDTKKDTE
ncbi:hypothetical protein SAMN04488030_2474 [Aliiroseovarius halocynthiae]|uniref:Uncharacterized protein n=2 Tax=Aliiroseovarius halocynthiae TaxID=985055 RepID=A0A545SQG3_9RHOB|nr:hypothetical protein FIL88_11185 [Aliiroseovarius halocynthiae]SMR82132.1 hypothetical protein SAMN04488030_2474 [Aliiroseovarius halocynthiae]